MHGTTPQEVYLFNFAHPLRKFDATREFPTISSRECAIVSRLLMPTMY